MCVTGRAALFVLVIAAGARAEDAPALVQATPNFSNAIAGPGFAITWNAKPSELTVDEALQLTITFTGATNPDRVRRPPLREKPAFKSAFREILDDGETTTASAIQFRYRLRLRETSLQAVPELAIAYYAPGRATVATKYLDAIPLTIRPALAPPSLTRPIDAPERLFAWPAERSHFHPGWLGWGALASGLVLFTLGGIFIERRRNPHGVRLARLRRNWVVRAAWDELDRATESTDPAGSALRVLHEYLASRHGIRAVAPTPRDFVRALVAAEIPSDRIDAVRTLAEAGDAARFTPERAVSDLVPRVRELILDWESES